MANMKQGDIQKCICCGKGVMHNGNLMFFTLTIQRFMCDPKAIKRQHGLEMQLDGHAALAHIMGPDEDMFKSISEERKVWVCMECGVTPQNIAFIEETAYEKEEQKKEAQGDLS